MCANAYDVIEQSGQNRSHRTVCVRFWRGFRLSHAAVPRLFRIDKSVISRHAGMVWTPFAIARRKLSRRLDQRKVAS